jgi:NADH-ubiquinone oxidoreductase chain 5
MNIRLIIEWMLFNFNSINIEIFVLIDWISILFISVVILISSMIILYSIIYIRGEKFLSRFIKLVILFVLSMIIMVIRPNIIRILFGWDGLGLISYCLVIFYQNYISFNSGIVTVLCNRIGDIGLLIAIGLIFIYGRWGIYILNKKVKFLILLMIFIAGITKRAQIPFSVWLPIAMAAPTPVSALVHSSTLVTAGVYLIIRFNKVIIFSGIDKILFYISVLTIFISGLIANFEVDLKKIIALSTLSQLGLIIIILRLRLKLLAFYHLLTHAVFKSLLFICAGIIIHLINNNQDIRLSGKLNEFIPFTIIRFYISRIALIGFPFLAGFYSKDLIMEIIYILNVNLFVIWFIILSLSFTVSYSFRLFYYIYFGEIKIRFRYYKEDKLINLSIVLLLLLRVICGSILNWIFFFDLRITFIIFRAKILTLSILIFGLFIGLYFFLKNIIFIYFFRFFFRSMWYINYLYYIIYKPYLNYGNERFGIDKKWVEFYRKKILLNLIEFIKFYRQNKYFKIYIFIFILIFIYFSIILLF